MDWLLFIIGVLATFRLSLLLSAEDGPAYIFRKLRNLPPKKSSVHEGVRCLFCTSVWMSSLTTTFFAMTGRIEWVDWVLYWLAFSAGAIVINNGLTRKPD